MIGLGRYRTALLCTAALVALAALLLPFGSSTTRDALGISSDRSESGAIVLHDASLRRRPTSWLLDARADIELPPPVRAGLDSGVPLEFVLELSLHEPRTFLPDRTVLDVTRRYGLVYYELTRHYRVRSIEDGTDRNYRSLSTALAGLGTLRDVPLDGASDASHAGAALPTSVAEAVSGGAGRPPRAPLRARLSMKLDDRALPLPLQSPFGSTWHLASEPLRWTHRAGRPS